MATTPVTPTAPAQSWLQRHERIVIVALVLLAGAWGFTKYADISASKAEARATVAEQALSTQKAADAQNAATTASVLAQYQSMVTALSAQNASLAAAAAQRQATVVKNQATDATLALPVLANRLATLGNVPDGQVSSDPSHVILTQSGAVAVTQTLETIPALNANLADAKDLLGSAQAAQAQAQTVITDQSTQIAGLKLTVTDEENSCKAQIAVVKTEARKGKIKAFKWGFGLGFISGLFVGHAAGF